VTTCKKPPNFGISDFFHGYRLFSSSDAAFQHTESLIILFNMKNLVDRFIRYAKVDTESDPNSESYPSTQKQFDLLKMLEQELNELGLAEIELDNNGYLTALLPATSGSEKVPTVAFIAHVDTTCESPGKDVNPTLHENYQGGDIKLANGDVIAVKENPNLERVIGDTVITTDGTTLLGADDKAGIAEIMTLLEELVNNPSIAHGPVKVAFTPDEEIGKGTLHFDVKKFAADYAYTVDGTDLGEVENETFTAYGADIKVTGINIHPGQAKDKMVNAIRVLSSIVDQLPKEMAPETTEKKQGFIHPLSFQGDVTECSLKMILRDFDLEGIHKEIKILEGICSKTEKAYPGAKIELNHKEQYKNMRYAIEKDPKVVDYALEAVKRAGVEPKLGFIRGGTDGAQLSFKGLLTPNIFAGGQNIHSKKEWVSVGWMEKSTQTLLELVKIWQEKEV
jgi:tripeptide aminopeptidase